MAEIAIRSLPFCPVYERNKIFAFDFVYFLAQEYRTNWKPYDWPFYYIDPLSPMTSDIADRARMLLKNCERFYAEKYEELVPPGVVGRPEIFYGHAKYMFETHFNSCGSAEDFFHTMVYVGRLGILFYQKGIYGTPNYAVVAIGESLMYFMRHYGPGIFPMFSVIGQSFVAQSQNNAR